jgi:hypothetical protein
MKFKTVSVYLREHGSRKLRKATPKDDQPDQIFVLRFGSTWETLAPGTGFYQAKIAAVAKQRALANGTAVVPAPQPRNQSPDALDVQIEAYLKSIEKHRSHKTSLAYSLL